ncbi:hypothetical protein DC915_RS25260 [Vibrio parahaemolyticus]|nr:hypothetical protein [Vibrio parahaemolyticus]
MHSFVYCLTNLDTNEKYIGKKNFNAKVKGKYQFSNWERYQGSSDITKKWNPERIEKKILRICYSAYESNYYEIAYLFATKALLRSDYVNYAVGSQTIGRVPNYMKIE